MNRQAIQISNHISLTHVCMHTQADAIPRSSLKTHAAHLVVFRTVFEDQAHIGHKLLDRLVVLGIPQLQLLLHLL